MDLINSTLGKALGGASGGFTTGPAAVVGILRQRSRPYLFSNSLAPSIVGSSLKAVEIVERDDSLRSQLARNTGVFRSKMKSAGFRLLVRYARPSMRYRVVFLRHIAWRLRAV